MGNLDLWAAVVSADDDDSEESTSAGGPLRICNGSAAGINQTAVAPGGRLLALACDVRGLRGRNLKQWHKGGNLLAVYTLNARS